MTIFPEITAHEFRPVLSKGSLLDSQRVLASQVDTVRRMLNKVEVTTNDREATTIDSLTQIQDFLPSPRGVAASGKVSAINVGGARVSGSKLQTGGVARGNNLKNDVFEVVQKIVFR